MICDVLMDVIDRLLIDACGEGLGTSLLSATDAWLSCWMVGRGQSERKSVLYSN